MPIERNSVTFVNKDFEPTSATDVLLKYRSTIIDELRQNLIALDKDQPGKLLQSIDIKVTQNNNLLVFTLSMEDYWKYVDEGRRKGAKMPPISAMLEFIKVRGIKPRNTKLIKVKNKTVRKAVKQVNRDKALKQVAFAIGKSIKKKGIKPTYFFSDVINEDLYLEMKTDLELALKKDIEITFTV